MNKFSLEHIPLILILMVFVIDKVISGLKQRGVDLHLIGRQVYDLHRWHNVNDPEEPGIKIWLKGNKTLADAITKLADNLDQQTKYLSKMDRRIERIEDAVVGNSIRKRVDAI